MDFLEKCKNLLLSPIPVQCLPNLAQMIFGPSFTKVIRWIFTFQNRFFGRADQKRRRSRPKRRKGISQQPSGGEAAQSDARAYLSNRLFDRCTSALGPCPAWPLHCCLQLYLVAKQRSCEATYVFLLIGGQAAKLRSHLCVSTYSYYYSSSPIGVYGSP